MPESSPDLIARLASVLASVHTVESVTERLCEAGRQMFDADGAAITLMTSTESFALVASTDELASRLEDLQDVVGEGPSKDAFRERTVQAADFTVAGDVRWPLLHSQGRGLGFEGSIIAVPLRPAETVIGTLTVHRRGGLVPDDGLLGEFLSVAIGTAVLHDPQLGRQGDVYAEVWASRAEVHQATGMVISQVGVRPEDAVALLRGQAFANDTTLLEVARQVIGRQINFRDFTIEGD